MPLGSTGGLTGSPPACYTPPMSAPFETELEMARCNVREREERLARQAKIVAEMERDNPEAATLSKQLLDLLQSTLDLARRRLRDLELRSKR